MNKKGGLYTDYQPLEEKLKYLSDEKGFFFNYNIFFNIQL